MAQNISVSDYVWVRPALNDEFSIPLGGRVAAIEPKRIRITTDNAGEIYVAREQIVKLMHSTCVKDVNDMITLGDLTEYSILRNLEMRYYKKNIYTYTGSMLVAVNPYEKLPIYTNALIRDYQGVPMHELPPHIFATGDASFNNMLKSRKDQCIVISGESGAGKTESTKLILQYLATVSGKHSWIEEQILQANPILEAFGNAKTVRNDNSSRFGKYIDIHFAKDAIIGAKIDQYLLEKSRIVSLNEGERNYHIFYSMLAGLSRDERRKLDLDDASNYRYLNQGKSLKCDGRNEQQEFTEIRNAFTVLNFNDEATWSVFEILAAILHLGNIKFRGQVVKNMETSEVENPRNLEKIAELLMVNKNELGKAITRKSIMVSGDRVTQDLSKEQAADSRDAFVKGLYGKLFIHLVEKINVTICQNGNLRKTSIGVLDIFGFENFTINSFEQLCINYANENLQQFFVKHIFKMEQEYYTNEGINWEKIKFIDNQDILDMIGMKPMNIMSLVDDETRFPKGTDTSMLTKLHEQHGKTKNYIKPKFDVEPFFGIQHFAGNVNYQSSGFLEKNRDSFSLDLKEVIASSGKNLIVEIFKNNGSEEIKQKAKSYTLSSQFRQSLEVLMKKLNECQPFFVRCIKPNEDKRPNMFDRDLCVRQLRYSGMMETAKIRQAGYPIRHEFVHFVNRFRFLVINLDHRQDPLIVAKKICQANFFKGEDYQIGHTKVFLKDVDNQYLEEERQRILARYITVLQRNIKGWIYRRRYQKLKAAAIVFQKYFRARGMRTRFLRIQRGYHRLQATIMSRKLTFNFKKLRESIRKVQARARAFHVRQHTKFGKIVEAVVIRKHEEKSLKTQGNRDYKYIADTNFQQRLQILDRQYEVKARPVPPPEPEVSEDSEGIRLVMDDLDNILNEYDGQSPQLKKQHADEDLSDFAFQKYASTHFSPTTTDYFSKKKLRGPLHVGHKLPTPDDIIAAQTIWITILRFMGDIAEPPLESGNKRKSVMLAINQTIGKNFSNRKEYQDILRLERKMDTMTRDQRQKYINKTLKRKDRLLEDLKRGMVTDNDGMEMYTEWMNTRKKHTDKLYFIIGHGILRKELRDEILCQIVKQLRQNPNESSKAKGWILLSMCIGCFPPSDTLYNYLRAFIRTAAPPAYAAYCEMRLIRTKQNGARNQPPTAMEMAASKSTQQLTVTVQLMNKETITLNVDSATTASEMCAQIAKKFNLRDYEGFSVFISCCDKVLSIGNDNEHLMDAICQCEQYAREVGRSEKEPDLWKLILRFEMFNPWYDASSDPVATDLIYCQVVSSFKHGEFGYPNDEMSATLVAQRYYIEKSTSLNTNTLDACFQDFVPKHVQVRGNLDAFKTKVIQTFLQLPAVKEKQTQIKVKEEVVNKAMHAFPIMFSKFFEAIVVSGLDLPKNSIIIAINWSGVFFIDQQEKILLDLSYPELLRVSFTQDERSQMDKVTLHAVTSEDFVLQSPEANRISEVLNHLLYGLRQRSKYCVAERDCKDDGYLQFRRGELIILENGMTGESAQTWAVGSCQGRQGDFPMDHVRVLPCLQPPTQDVLDAYKKGMFTYKHRKGDTIKRLKQHTLVHYAEENYRQARRLTEQQSSVLGTIAQKQTEELWKFTAKPLRQALLKRVLDDPDRSLNTKACEVFMNILRYLELMPGQPTESVKYATAVFEPCMESELLHDEVYCQIMRQLTYNPMDQCERKAWELLYLATGLFLPTATLLQEAMKFTESRMHPLASVCHDRLLQRQTEKLTSRKCPPVAIEIESIQKSHTEIYHRIYFPDDTDESCLVDSFTKAGDVADELKKRLHLKTIAGFSLIVVVGEKAFSMPNDAYFYDFLYEVHEWLKSTTTQQVYTQTAMTRTTPQLLIFFIKKLWLDGVIGDDRNADMIFHYNQEVQKYLKGYQKCTEEEAVRMSSLILRIKYPNPMKDLNDCVAQIIPYYFYKTKNATYWKKAIADGYRQVATMEFDDAKLEFLKIISKLPTFGSTFFDVKEVQNSEPEIMAINRHGIHKINPVTKDVVLTYKLSELVNWSSGNTFFSLTVGDMQRTKKILWETTQGYKMDDLLSSYAEIANKPTRKAEQVFDF